MGDFFSKSKHDLSILDPSTGDTLGFICDRVEGKPAYAEYDGKSFVDLFSTSPTQTSTNPEEELVLGSETHHAGFGKEYYDSGDRKRYFESIGMDLSYEGQAIAGWSSTGIALTSATLATVTIANADMELDASWTTGTGTWGQSSTYFRSSSKSWKCTNGNTNDYVYQNLTGWAPGGSYTVTVWARNNDESNRTVKVGVSDGVTTTYGNAVTLTSTWQQVTHTKVLSTIATNLQIRFFISNGGGNDNMYFDDAAISGATHTISGTVSTQCHATFNDEEYIGVDEFLVKLNATGNGWTLAGEMPADITCLTPFQVSGTDYLMICLGTSTSFEYMTTAEVFAVSTADEKTYQFAAWVKTTAPTMYANDGDNTVRSTATPTAGGATWSAQTVIGFSSDAFTWLTDKDGALLAWKEDIPYYLDSSGNEKQDLAPEARSGKSTHSGKNGTIWQGEVFAPIGDQALLRVGTSNSWVQPSKFISNSTAFSGQVEAVAGDEEWLYAATDNSTKVEILKFRDEVIDGTTRQVWHPIHELTLTGVETMWVSTVYQKRLWISSTLESDSLYYLPLPKKYGDITNDSNAVFKTDTYFITPWLHGDFKSTDKALIKIEATLGHAWDTLIYFECWMQKLGETSWATDMGDLKGSATTRKHTLYRTVSTTSTMFRFKFIAVTDDTGKTPILLDYKVTALLHPDAKKVIHAKVRVKRDSVGLGGLTSGQMYELQKTCIQNCKDAVWVVTIKEYVTDKHGVSHYVKFLPLPQSMKALEVTNKEVGKDGELEFNLLMLVVPLS